MPKSTDTPSLFTAHDELSRVIPPDLAKAFLDHRKMLKKPMTPFAAQLMARKLELMPDRIASVEQSIVKGWSDVFEVRNDSTTFEQRSQRLSASERRRQYVMEEIRNGSGSRGEASADRRADGPLLIGRRP